MVGGELYIVLFVMVYFEHDPPESSRSEFLRPQPKGTYVNCFIYGEH